MQEGWIRLYRSILDWEWFTDTCTFKLFVYLLIKANHQNKKWRGHEVKRGQHITSYSSLSKATGLSIQEVRTSIKKLKSTNEITCNPTSKFTLITICNYHTYQPERVEANTQNGEQSNKEATNDQQTTNTQSTTNKNDKNDKNERSSTLTAAINEICELWNSFAKKKVNPLRVGEIQQVVKLLNSVPGCDYEDFMAALENYKKACELNTSQAWPFNLHNFALTGYEKFLPGKFDIDNYDKSNFEKDSDDGSEFKCL